MKVGMTSIMVRPYDEGDLLPVGRVHALSRRAAYAGLVPADALAKVTPETQVEVWRERLSRAPPSSWQSATVRWSGSPHCSRPRRAPS